MTTPLVQSISDEQLAELERFLSFGGSMLKVKSSAVSGLIARMRAAEADAKRYQYLKSRCDDGFIVELENHVFQSMWDQTIDQAMTEPKP
ncbi:hypothetical protein ACNFCJ_21045 [Pseudomonas sp. NY15364]|uniref:hypothetical protein n=1 Tax=Pseudomonas sp. NY15364 TaxID=3400353 RepID=UPI003A853862